LLTFPSIKHLIGVKEKISNRSLRNTILS